MGNLDGIRGEEDARLSIERREQAAAGPAAVWWAMRHAIGAMGPARAARALFKVNQAEGFDCPGCAWPEPERPHRIEFCENGAKAVAEEATRKRIDRAFFAKHSTADLAERSDHWLGQQGRLTEPMLLDADATHYAPISWEEAFRLISEELQSLPCPDEAVFYTSGRTSNEAAFAYQLLVRAFGTNNLPDCSNMCHESSGVALTQAIGMGKGSVSLEDFAKAELIVIVGQNPGTNHPRMLSTLEEAKRAGAKIVSVNPLPEVGLMRFKNPQRPSGILGKGTPLSDSFLQIRLGGDLALFKAVNRRLFELDAEWRNREPAASAIDHRFLDEHCEGVKELREELSGLDWGEVIEATGLRDEQIEELSQQIARSERIIVCWAMGLTQHRDAVATIREIANTLLLRGAIGKPGAGACPVRGHSNVQGDRTMGIFEKPTEDFLQRLGAAFHFDPPRKHGHDVVDSIEAMARGEVKVFFAMGGNFLSATPDTIATSSALERLRLTVQVSTKLNRSHLITGRRALILPTLGRTERDRQASGEQQVTVEDSMGIVHASKGHLEPASHTLLSEVSIVCRLARRLLGERHGIPWQAFEDDYGAIRDRIAEVIPGFEDFNERIGLSPGEQRAGVSAVEPISNGADTTRASSGRFVLPHPPRDERRFPTPTGRARLSVNPLRVLRLPRGRLLLQTMRSHDQYNTTIYGLNDRYRGVKAGRKVVLVNPEDLAELGLADGEIVDIVSEWHEGERVEERVVERFRATSYPTAKGCAAAYYPETNPLVPLTARAAESGTPASKSLTIRLERRPASAPPPPQTPPRP